MENNEKKTFVQRIPDIVNTAFEYSKYNKTGVLSKLFYGNKLEKAYKEGAEEVIAEQKMLMGEEKFNEYYDVEKLNQKLDSAKEKQEKQKEKINTNLDEIENTARDVKNRTSGNNSSNPTDINNVLSDSEKLAYQLNANEQLVKATNERRRQSNLETKQLGDTMNIEEKIQGRTGDLLQKIQMRGEKKAKEKEQEINTNISMVTSSLGNALDLGRHYSSGRQMRKRGGSW